MHGLPALHVRMALMALVSLALACTFTQPPPTPTPAPSATPTITATVTPTSTRPPTLTPLPSPSPTPIPACAPYYFYPIAFTPDNRYLLGRSGPQILVFDLETLQVTRRLEAGQPIQQAILSQDGKTLAWSLEDHNIQLVNLADGDVLHNLTRHTARVDSLSFNAAADRLASADAEGWVRLWDNKGAELLAFQPGGEIFAIGLAPVGGQLVTISFEGPPSLWNLADINPGEPAPISVLGSSGAFNPASVQFDSSGRTVALSFGGGPVALYQLPEGSLLWSGGDFALALGGQEFAYTDREPDGSTVIVLAGADGTVHRRLPAGLFTIWRLFYSPDASWLLSADDLHLSLWDVTRGQLVLNLQASCP